MKTLAVLVPFLFLAGCVQSLHPFVTDEQVAFDKTVIGHWSDSDGKHVLDIPEAATDPEAKTYRVAYTDEHDKTGHFVARLAKVDKYTIADIAPEEMTDNDGGTYKAHFLPVHSFLLVEIAQDKLRIRAMDYDWLKKELEAHPEALAHELADGDRIILTATTDKAQTYVIKHANTPGAYGDWTEFKRAPAKPTTQPAK